ncbi:MAG: hypothetical protein IT261_10650 [Saprospiraceae bacterium]|nr:hypothetical protein [Saprospiraceae bacterium]
MYNRFLSSIPGCSGLSWVMIYSLLTIFFCQCKNIKPVEAVFQLDKNTDATVLMNPEDPADEQINRTLFLFAASLCRSLKQPDDIRFLLKDLPYNTYGEWSLATDSLLNTRLGLEDQYHAVAKANQWPASTFSQFNAMTYKGGIPD